MEQTSVFKICEKDGFIWITLPDAINMNNYLDLEKAIYDNISQQCPKVVVDLCNTKNLYSSGLGLLIRLRKYINEKKGLLFLVNVSKKIFDLLEAVHLERLFNCYATETEFEISFEEIIKNKIESKFKDFVFVAKIENGIYRINISGKLTGNTDLSEIKNFSYDSHVKIYVFDLSGIDKIDSNGIYILSHLFVNLKNNSARVLIYGADAYLKELINVLNLSDFVECYSTEKDAFDAIKNY
jgi:anti-anti-sigma factor